ncbi:hypothetical protein ZIOFF_003654 [Zingiber officinale]|uniref:Auxin-responsive protein n=1 Tax=Zingiber officinale TaxID=94328 RepID=A0A8J5MAP9_ZINOF|nr:hypothetical protein ZIOFF_003654 [Zingiber officinale]
MLAVGDRIFGQSGIPQSRVENSALLKRLANINQKYNEAAVDNRILKANVETLRAKAKSYLSFTFVKMEEDVKPLTGMTLFYSTIADMSSANDRGGVIVDRMANGLGLEETELRLGLGLDGGGGGEDEGSKKRGFEETIDLKLQLHMPSDSEKSEATLESSDNMAVGWPPVRSFRKNILYVHPEKHVCDSSNSPAAFVKVGMDGAPYLRKVDLKMFNSYQELSMAPQKMFSSFTTSTRMRACRNSCSPGMSERDYMNESKVMNLLNGSDYVRTYEDKDGDWMLVGDVPWE